MPNNVLIPSKIRDALFIKGKDYRYIVLYGGRGGAKSYGVADYLLYQALTRNVRILCTREFQSSIADSVYKLLLDRIDEHGYSSYFHITQTSIINPYNSSEFIFKGLTRNISEIKSTEGIDLCWVEEAEKVSSEHWDILTPTIRKPDSKIIITFNPEEEENATYQQFVLKPSPNTLTQKVNYYDNPFFPDVLRVEMEYDKINDPERYNWKWLGECRKVSEAVVFRGRFSELDFETPEDARFFHGVDWGFYPDPTAVVRCFIMDNKLYIDKEVYGSKIELDDMPSAFDRIPTMRRWPIKADNARPETIAFMRRKGFNISAAKKWKGSIEDGIAYLKSFQHIYIHPSCRNTLENFKLYRYKVDTNNSQVLPIVVDKDNHAIDAIRYALDGYITGHSTLARIVYGENG